MNIPSIFSRVYNGKPNFITPTMISYGSFHNAKFIYELSRGDGIFGRSKYIYGVTVLELDNGEYKPNNDLSIGGFYTEEEALHYIDELKERSNSNEWEWILVYW